MATASSKLQIIIDVLTGGSQQEVSGLEKAFKGLTDTVVKTSAAIAVVVTTMDKIFEFGKAGAVVVQTGESFEFLMEKLGITEDILWDLSEASGHTISDMDIMKSTMTLLAGTSDDLGKALVENAPKLMEIAKAANKLNPALGDTTFMYDSINAGIKRNSKLILDNLGIIVDLGDAYDTYAEQIGKTADSLTAAEQQQALLNAVLATGSQIIEQVGNDLDSLVDPFSRMETSMANAADAVKGKFAPFLADAADAIYYLIDGVDLINQAFAAHEDQVADTAGSYEEYVTEVMRAAQVAGYLTDYEAQLYEQFLLTGDATALLTGMTGGLSEQQMAVRFTTEELAAMTEELTGKVDILTESEFDLGRVTSELAGEYENLEDRQRAAAEAATESIPAWKKLSEGLAEGHGDAQELSLALGEVEGDLYGVAGGLDAAAAAAQAAADGYTEYMNVFEDTSPAESAEGVIDVASDAMLEAATAAEAAGEDATAYWSALAELNPELYTAAQESKAFADAQAILIPMLADGSLEGPVYAQAMQDLALGIEAGVEPTTALDVVMAQLGIDMETAYNTGASLQGTVDGLVAGSPYQLEVITTFTEIGSPPSTGGGDSGGTTTGSGDTGTGGNDYAAGTNGWETVPGGYPGDSYRVGLTSGEQFAVVPAGEKMPGGGTVINQYNTVTNTNPLTAAMNQAFIDSSLTAEFRGQL